MKTAVPFYFLILLLVFSCRSKKIFSEKEKTTQIDTITITETQIDTIFRDRIIEKTKPVFSEIVVESPCDSLGNIRDIDTRIGSGGNQAWIYSQNGKLYLGQKLDSVQNILDKTYIARWRHDSINLRKQLLKDFRSTEKTKMIVWPWWLWTALIIGGLSIIWNIYRKIKPV